MMVMQSDVDVEAVDAIGEEARTRVYPVIVRYLQENQRPPSLNWLMMELGYSSTSVTRDRVNKLVECGWLKREGGFVQVEGARIVLGNSVWDRLNHG